MPRYPLVALATLMTAACGACGDAPCEETKTCNVGPDPTGSTSSSGVGGAPSTSSASSSGVGGSGGGPSAVVPVDLAAGSHTTCSVMSNGGAFCWGDNRFGQLGIGSTTNALSPVQVFGLTTAKSIDTGYRTCAIMEDDSLRCWGEAPVGDGSGSSASAKPVDLGQGVRSVSTGSAIPATTAIFHTCAALMDGSVQCWGVNNSAQLGVPSSGGSNTPVTAAATGVEKVASGGAHTCSIGSSGPQCWGMGANLGNTAASGGPTPVSVSDLFAAEEVVVGGGHGCGRQNDGTVKCWGENASGGVLGQMAGSKTPVTVPNLPGAVQLCAGLVHNCALLGTGEVRCWGANNDGQLGDGTKTSRATPEPVVGLPKNMLQVACGQGHSCARNAEGVYCWGDNDAGQLGFGTTTESLTALPVTF